MTGIVPSPFNITVDVTPLATYSTVYGAVPLENTKYRSSTPLFVHTSRDEEVTDTSNVSCIYTYK